MKKKIVGIIAVVAIAAIAGYNVYSSQNDVKLSDFILSEMEALATSEVGCISRTGQNDGHCTTDGTYYFCENDSWMTKKDCVKKMYASIHS